MTRAVWCVAWKHPKTGKTEWCATYRGKKPDEIALADYARCGACVVFRIGNDRRLPTCCDCRARMGLKGGTSVT